MQNYTQLQETASKLFVGLHYIAIASITISLIALMIAIASYSRTKKFLDYEYSPRIQILDEHIMCCSPPLKDIPALSYRAEIENR